MRKADDGVRQRVWRLVSDVRGHVYSPGAAAGRLMLGLKTDMDAEGCQVFPAR